MAHNKTSSTYIATVMDKSVEEVDGIISDADISYGAILDEIGEINAEAYITKIAEVLGVKSKYVLPLADTLILKKSIQATCSKYGLARETYYKIVLPKVRANPGGIPLLQQLLEPHEAHKLRIEHVFYRTIEDKIEQGEQWACKLWAEMTGKRKSAGPVRINIGQQMNIDPVAIESQRKKIITQDIIKLKLKK